MVRRRRRIFSIIGWVIAGIVSLILLVTLLFYLGRGWIMKRTVAYLNKNQPGEIIMEKMNLIPFAGFPDVLLQLRNVGFYEKKVLPDSLYQEPILFLNNIYISLDIVDLIKGNLEVSQVRLNHGFLRIEVHKDSVTNLEYALGRRFGEGPTEDTLSGMPTMRIDLDRIELTDILLLFEDQVGGNLANLKINQLESRFSYHPDIIESDVKLNIDINEVKYLTYNIEDKDSIQFESEIIYEPETKNVSIKPSMLKIAGLDLDVWGYYSFFRGKYINLAFRATNTGLDVLNFLFLGVLDMDEIEQVGFGSIHLEGSVTGNMDHRPPVIRVNGSANQIGFRIKPIKRDVTNISFNMFATNGGNPDLSEARLEIDNFSASFPEGTLQLRMEAENLVKPEFDVELRGEVELTGLDQMIKIDSLKDLGGHMSMSGDLKGVLDRNSDSFLDETGTVSIMADDVKFIWKKDTVSGLTGELFMDKDLLGSRDLDVVYNGDHMGIKVEVENLLYYLLGFERDVNIKASMTSDLFHPAKMLHDTMITALLGEELRRLYLGAEVSITKHQLDLFLREDSIPYAEISLDSFGIELPYYADISNMKASLSMGPDTIILHYLNADIGGSSLSISGQAINYGALMHQDSGKMIGLEYSLTSDLLRAEDIFSFKNGFLLPEIYRTEYMDDLHFSGSLWLPAAAALNDSIGPDFAMNMNNLGWRFRYYPLEFKNFTVRLKREGKELTIDELTGKIGDNDLKLEALLGNFNDTVRQNIYGHMTLESDLLDLNELLNYQLPENLKDTIPSDAVAGSGPPRFDRIDYPDFSLYVDIGELCFGENKIFGIKGGLKSSRDKILYLDHLLMGNESGGTMELNGQINVADSSYYVFGTELELEGLRIRDLNFEMQIGEDTYTLRENFAGLVTASGLAEVFITPDLKLDMSATTAMFNVELRDGELNNFLPLQAAGKYLDNKDLYHVKFSTLRNSFTLMDSTIIIPLMSVESTIGQLLIEGEQKLDNSYLYLLRVPTWLVKEAARSRLSNAADDEEHDQIRKMTMGNFLKLTLWSNGIESEVKLNDKRDRYR